MACCWYTCLNFGLLHDDGLFALAPSQGSSNTWAVFWAFFLSPAISISDRFGWEPPKLFVPDIQTQTRASKDQPLPLSRFIASSGCVRVWEVGSPFKEVRWFNRLSTRISACPRPSSRLS